MLECRVYIAGNWIDFEVLNISCGYVIDTSVECIAGQIYTVVYRKRAQQSMFIKNSQVLFKKIIISFKFI